MDKYYLKDSEKFDSLRQQLQMLDLDNQNYDDGNRFVTPEIATRLRVLLYSKSHSKGLLKQLNLLGLKFKNTSGPIREGTGGGFQMVSLQVVALKNPDTNKPLFDHFYAPIFRDGPSYPPEPFPQWWNQVIYRHDDILMTRKKLVLAVTNKDGGAHIDDHLETQYHLMKEYGSNMTIHAEGSLGNFDFHFTRGIIEAFIRQISFEVIETLNPFLRAKIDPTNES